MKEIQFEIAQYRLSKLNFQILTEDVKSEKVEFSFEISCSHSIKDNKATVVLGVKTPADKMPFTIDVVYQAVFLFSQSMSSVAEPERDKLIKVNCSALLFPFIRETIAETTRKAGYAPLILPPTNFLALFEKENAANQKVSG
jgi:preprotein translocase subunit SecB